MAQNFDPANSQPNPAGNPNLNPFDPNNQNFQPQQADPNQVSPFGQNQPFNQGIDPNFNPTPNPFVQNNSGPFPPQPENFTPQQNPFNNFNSPNPNEPNQTFNQDAEPNFNNPNPNPFNQNNQNFQPQPTDPNQVSPFNQNQNNLSTNNGDFSNFQNQADFSSGANEDFNQPIEPVPQEINPDFSNQNLDPNSAPLDSFNSQNTFDESQNNQYNDPNSLSQTPDNFQYNDANPYDPNYPESGDFDPNQDPNQGSTFGQKQSGSKFFLIIAGFVIVALLVGTVVLYMANQDRRQPETVQNQTPQPSSQVVDLNSSSFTSTSSSETSLTSSISSQPQSSASTQSSSSNLTVGGSIDTPAAKAKINNATKVPADWLKRFFFNKGIDENGVCNNGSICGEAADPDADGLTNIDEYNYGADPQNEDTDSDGISDGDEINVYYTNPNTKDSNGDKINDLDALFSCTDQIQTTKGKMTQARLDIIKSNNQLKPLHKRTITSFQQRGASAQDIQLGYIKLACTTSNVEL